MWSMHKAARARARVAAAWMLTLLVAGCGSDNVALQPQRVAVSAQPNGIAVRPGDGAVFMTDDATNSVLSSADGRAFAHYASIPAVAGQANSLSQLTFADSRTLLIERFGFGTASAVFDISAPDTVAALAGPNPARRRLGLATVGSGQALSTWFIKTGSQPPQGGVSLLTYDVSAGTAAERDLLTGLGKPVGVVVSGNTVFVSDQANNTIVSAPLDALLASTQAVTPGTVVAQISGPDLLATDGNGTLFTKCNATGFCKIASNGAVTVIANDFQDARGAAVDTSRHLIYVVDRAAAGGTSYVHILPLP